MTQSLQDIDTSAWILLEEAVRDAHSGFHFMNLCTLDDQGHPQARMVVLRRVDRSRRLLEFHTDTRSPKWREIAANPHVTVLGYCHQTRLQQRLRGVVKQHAFGSAAAATAWSGLSVHTQSTYQGGPPGDDPASSFSDKSDQTHPATAAADGKEHFGVLFVQVHQLDWYQLARGNNLRALLTYSHSGECSASLWINP